MIRRYAFHPLLLAAFPVLFLWSQNRNEVLFGHVADPLALTLVVTLAGFALASLALRDHRRGAVVASGLAFLTLSFGHALELLPAAIGPRKLLALWLVLAVLVIVGAVVVDRHLGDLTSALNLVALVLFVSAVAPLAPRIVSPSPSTGPVSSAADRDAHGGTLAGRDIFYIVPDRYPSERNLRELFGEDNSEFLGYLEERGFQVADDSITNYNKTAHALAAALNLEYLDELAERVRSSRADQGDWQPLYDRIHDHAVGRFLTDNGYRHIQVGMWWQPTADAATADVVYRRGETTEFQRVFEQTTPIPTVRSIVWGEPEDRGNRGEVRETTLFQLRQLEDLADRRSPQPRFVMAHLSLPHEPYVFDEDGAWISQQEEAARSHEENVVGHVRYTNERLRRLVDRLLEGPEDQHPIIIIQADEALHPKRYRMDEPPFVWPEATDAELLQKFRILSAFYLPGVDVEVPEGISPVNTFRMVFDAYFGTDHGLLPDRAYVMHNHHRLYDLTEVTDRVRGGSIPAGFEP